VAAVNLYRYCFCFTAPIAGVDCSGLVVVVHWYWTTGALPGRWGGAFGFLWRETMQRSKAEVESRFRARCDLISGACPTVDLWNWANIFVLHTLKIASARHLSI
jgi:hypothetical protein